MKKHVRFRDPNRSGKLRRRTAVGKFGGSLAGVPAFALGATVIKQLLEAPESLEDGPPLGKVVHNHGDRKSPKDRVFPLTSGLNGL